MAPFTRKQEKGFSRIRLQTGINKKSGQIENFIRAKIAKRTGGNKCFVDLPLNFDDCRYYLVERDTTMPNLKEQLAKLQCDREVPIPAHLYRIVAQPKILLSLNDCDYGLAIEADHLTVSGQPTSGYGMVRATHSVSHGRWYYEVEFLHQPVDSHTRIGWAQSISPLGACAGYTKFSYSWRSKRGTAFHDAYGKHYHDIGYKQGDVIGCLIELPTFEQQIKAGLDQSTILPDSKKQSHLIKFRRNHFFEEQHLPWMKAEANLEKFPQGLPSKIEFFLNGESCGVAYEDLYQGHYFPAVSLFHDAKLRCNFGHHFKFAPECVHNGGAKPLSARPKEMAQELLSANKLYVDKLEK